MRCFIAIDIDPQIKGSIAKLQQDIARSCQTDRSDIKWVQPDAMHITLRFLGQVPDQDIVDLCEVTKQVASRHTRFDLEIEAVGHFGRPATVLWLGTSHGTDQLNAIQQDLEDQLELAGWPRERRRFFAHLTLCRVKNPRVAREVITAYRPYMEINLGNTGVDELVVYQSQLQPDGPIYTPLGRYLLAV